MEHGDNIEGFPAILNRSHPLSRFSDAAFHQECFAKDPDGETMKSLLARWQAVMDQRPRNIPLAEAEEWARQAFEKLYAEDGFRT